jgi:hypothetical protein
LKTIEAFADAPTHVSAAFLLFSVFLMSSKSSPTDGLTTHSPLSQPPVDKFNHKNGSYVCSESPDEKVGSAHNAEPATKSTARESPRVLVG